MEPELTQGAISRIFGMGNSEEDRSFQPILQVLNIKKVAAGGGDRFRVSKTIVF